jgi:hypothetical protein
VLFVKPYPFFSCNFFFPALAVQRSGSTSSRILVFGRKDFESLVVNFRSGITSSDIHFFFVFGGTGFELRTS